ncbi:MAG: hypothetical protein KC444_06965 [Nitrosopumilus sp.]|nr:hypothetical protein [Nitrosopumilus sp.]
MDLIVDDYSHEITSQSIIELQNLTKWQYEKYGEWTTIIGGWAVWAYYQESFGSRDIDIVLPDDDSKKVEITDSYFPSNDIKIKYEDPFQKEYHYGKDIFTPKGHDEIVFDLFDPEKTRPDPDGLGVTVDWKWMTKFSKEQPIGKDAFIQVPDPELLLPVKMIAGLSRIEELKRTDNPKRKRSKIWKDYYDVGILAKHVDFNQEQLLEHMNRIGFTRDLVTRFLDGYIERYDTLEQAGTTLMTVTDKIPSLE